MARPYREEMSALSQTFAWAATANLERLRQAVRVAGESPLRAIGSGGSLTAAHALAALHQRYTGHLSAATTPLTAIAEPVDTNTASWLLSSGGSNVDIIEAAKSLILAEPRQLGILCAREASRLVELGQNHPFVEVLVYPPPVRRDGFLATNSLLGFITLLTRAYALEYHADIDWLEAVDSVKPLLSDDAPTLEAWEQATVPLWARPTTLVLHGPSTKVAAIDLESKFTEAAIGHLQFADYRNFAHGRHHWLAKRSEASAVLALVTDADRSLAEHTLGLIPKHVPQAHIALGGGPSAAALGSLVAALRITEWAGFRRGIDPGRPGVPQFGRKLYHLRSRLAPRPPPTSHTTLRDAAAITRKTGFTLARLAASGQLERWRDALGTFRERLHAARFTGIVLDYDGTVIDPRHPTALADTSMMAELERVVETGTGLAIATGRGASVRRDLRRSLPEALWHRVVVGYYSGAEVASLAEDDAPNGTFTTCAALRPLEEALLRWPELSGNACQENRCFQITLMSSNMFPASRLWEIAHQTVLATGCHDVSVTLSDDSVDILAPGVSKLNVLSRLRQAIGDGPILTIGDRGRWPGNDYQLLSEPYALGVDQVSADPATCWHLGEPGQRGPAVTLDYLSSLDADGGRLRFAEGALR